MKYASPPQSPDRLAKILPWLHLLGAVAIVMLHALYSALHSELGGEISAGESPGFAWIRDHIQIGIVAGLFYLIAVCCLQILRMPNFSTAGTRLLKIFVGLEVLSITATVALMFYPRADLLPLVLNGLLISVLLQGMISFWHAEPQEFGVGPELFQTPERGAAGFLICLFIFGAVIAFFDPSPKRMTDYIFLDSGFEHRLRFALPLMLSGVTSLWFGAGVLAILYCFCRGLPKIMKFQKSFSVISSLLFISLAAFVMAILFGSLWSAINWEISKLNLQINVLQLFSLLSIGGGILLAAVFRRITACMPRGENSSLVGIVCLSFGAAVIWPVAWLLTAKRPARATCRLLAFLVLAASGLVIYFVLFGRLFNPWFTVFSYHCCPGNNIIISMG